MEVISLLELMEEELANASKIPLGGGKIKVDPERFMDIINQIKGALPEDVKEADAFRRDKAQMISDANNEADNIVSQAKQQAVAMLNEAKEKATQATTSAEQWSANTVNEAKKQAAATINDANNQALHILSEHEIIRRATADANSILMRSREQSRQIRTAANEYAEDLFNNVGSFLNGHLEVLAENREALRRMNPQNQQNQAATVRNEGVSQNSGTQTRIQ